MFLVRRIVCWFLTTDLQQIFVLSVVELLSFEAHVQSECGRCMPALMPGVAGQLPLRKDAAGQGRNGSAFLARLVCLSRLQASGQVQMKQAEAAQNGSSDGQKVGALLFFLAASKSVMVTSQHLWLQELQRHKQTLQSVSEERPPILRHLLLDSSATEDT